MKEDHFKTILNKKSLKATNPRITLLMQMDKYGSAMPYTAIQKAMGSTDRVTLYRTLESLKKQGVIHKAFQENNEIYYAMCGDECMGHHHHHNHVHFKCTNCSAVTCEDLDQKVSISIPEYEIHKISINVEGLCKVCAA